MNEIINKLKIDTNKSSNIIYRHKRILFKNLYIIFDETVISSTSVSDFILRSLNNIYIPTYNNILNHISNFKYKEINTYKDLSLYLNSGFTIIIYNKNKYIALETRKDLTRGVSTPITENSTRGSLDSFTESIENNIGLIKRRIKDNNLWIKDYELGKYTHSKASLLYINTIANPNLVNYVDKLIKKIDIDGIISTGMIKNLIEKENKSVFPNILSTEKPYTVCKYLLEGHIAITLDNDPFVLILPITLNDFFIYEDDEYNKSINVTVTRIIRYIAFSIALITPGLYIALTTYNQELIPTELLTSIASQRESVPFSAFIEALLMILAFDILREGDLKLPSFANSALSIVGALILGEAAVSAGIVSPIMIIVVAITSISSLTFSEPDLIYSLRYYRLIIMIGATFFGIIGVFLSIIYLLINLINYESFNIPYLTPFSPTITSKLKDSIIKYPAIKLKKRNPLITNNITKNKTEENYE